jgi:hypothetical protein
MCVFESLRARDWVEKMASAILAISILVVTQWTSEKERWTSEKEI